MPPKSKSQRFLADSGNSTTSAFPQLVVELQKAETLGGITYSDLRYSAPLEETLRVGAPGHVNPQARKAKKQQQRRATSNAKDLSMFSDPFDSETPTVNLASFLNRPDLVSTLIHGDASSSDDTSPALDTSSSDGDEHSQTSPQPSSLNSPLHEREESQAKVDNPSRLSLPLTNKQQNGKGNNKINPNLNLPVIRSVSPRTLRQIARLPNANEKEAGRMKQMEEKFVNDSKAGFFTTAAKTKSGKSGGLYGNLKTKNYGRYEQNRGGAEVSDPKLLKKLLTDDIESLFVDDATKIRARQSRTMKNSRAEKKGVEKKGKSSSSQALFSKTQPLPPPLYDLEANGDLINSLSTFYDPELVTTLEIDRRKQMKDISNAVQMQKFSHGDATASHIIDLRRQLQGSIDTIHNDAARTQKQIHDAKHAGFVPEELLPENEMKSIHFEKGLATLDKFLVKGLRKMMAEGIRRWRRGVEVAYQEALVRAVTMVQRAYRKHQARVELAERMEQRRIQKAREDEIRRLFDLKQNRAAIVIQQRFRINTARKKVELRKLQLMKSQVIQRAWRVYAARKEMGSLRVAFNKEVNAATIIQKHWRAKQGRMYFRVVKKIKAMEEMERKEKEKVDAMKSYFEDQGAAVQIQYAWRRRQLWLNLRYFLGAQRQIKAVKLQQAYRMLKAKLEVKRRRAEKRRLDLLKLNSCILIQTYVRRYFAQIRVDKIKFDLEKASLIRRLEKVFALRPRIVALPVNKPLPKYTKGEKKGKVKINPDTGFEYEPEPVRVDLKQVRRDLIDVRRYVDPFTWTREKANATKIQKAYRGHRARARVTFKRQMEKLALRNWQKQRQESCATRLQAVFRGFKGRKYVTLMRHTSSCITIQKVVRGWEGRKIAFQKKRQRVAAVCIQKQHRGYVKRIAFQEYQRTFKIQQEPTRTIQRAGRCYIARKSVWRTRMELRARAEQNVIARANEHFCWKRSRLILLVESVYHEKGHRHDGLFQDFFKQWSGSDHNNHMESAHFVKMFKDATGIIGRPYVDLLTEKKRPFNVTDLDLMFSKKKGADVHHITYVQFVEMLDVINATLFPTVKEKLGFKGRNARMLEIILDHFFKGAISKSFKKNLDNRATEFCKKNVAKIQAQARGFHFRHMYKKQKEELARQAKITRDQAKSIHIQCLARRYLARKAAVKIAQRAYVKYVDPSTDEPYWSNPKTKSVTWAKPKVFGKFADVSHPTILPHKGTEFVVMCVNCASEITELVCHSCDDAFCKSCFDGLHTKGTRVNHKPTKINHCRECEYQLASKTCDTCTAEQHQSCNYCDVCHLNVHRFDEEKSKEHKWNWLVQCCVECREYAARWRCEECMDVYCTACFSKVHKRGTRVNHKCEPLTYYTPTIHDHYEREMREKSRRDRKQSDEESAELARQKLEYKSSMAVQKRYRGYRARKFGRAFLKEGRQQIRAEWRQRKKDDEIRLTKKYIALELLGLCKRLKSDTMEEAVLKSIPIFMRKRAKFWINQNLQDKYWYSDHLSIDKKKIPKRGFQVGKYEELCEQAFWGGIRLPGKHAIKQGKMDIETKPFEGTGHGLEKFVAIADRIRIKSHTYTVDKDAPEPTNDIVGIDRVWRFGDEKELVAYKFPAHGKYRKLARKVGYIFIEAQIFQMILRLGLRAGDFLETFLMLANRFAKGRLGMKAAGRIKSFSEKFKSSKKRISYFDVTKQSRMAVDSDELAAALAQPDLEADAEAAKIAGYLEDNGGMWEEREDEKTLKLIWVHKETGEIRDIKPDEAEEQAEKNEEERKFKESQKRVAKMRKGGRKELGRKRK
ncbi:hypothetical protein TrVE_jg10521 [Triparma verrucosa]|uniref:B box-type domain-containing protein n=1 Tax=Triparma verrucosa TaxID=1606542 RepID=A0A9W7FM56_9STRA|nr:hypothetical protein TrVE_jg10521 [Triparma verrucosa]